MLLCSIPHFSFSAIMLHEWAWLVKWLIQSQSNICWSPITGSIWSLLFIVLHYLLIKLWLKLYIEYKIKRWHEWVSWMENYLLVGNICNIIHNLNHSSLLFIIWSSHQGITIIFTEATTVDSNRQNKTQALFQFIPALEMTKTAAKRPQSMYCLKSVNPRFLSEFNRSRVIKCTAQREGIEISMIPISAAS